jgi:ABC-2 type transport system permease protein
MVVTAGPGGSIAGAAYPPRIRHFARLKLRILRNAMRGSAWRIVLFLVGVLLGLDAAFVGFTAVTLAGTASVRTAATVTAFVGSGLVLAWVLAPLLFFGVDETLDPARFALLPIPRRTLAVGMLAAALVGIPAVATLVATLGVVVGATIRGGPAAGAVALVGAVLGLLTCIVASRAVTSAFAGMLRSRRARDLAAILIAVLASSCGLIPAALQTMTPQIRLTDAARLADVLGWTPLGAPFVAPYDVAAGRPAAAVARLLIAAATVVLLLLWFSSTLETAMIGTASGGRRAARSRSAADDGPVNGPVNGPVDALYPRFLRALPRSQTGALMARESRYWWRDPRRRAQLISLMIASVVFALAYQFFGQGAGLRVAVVMSGVMAGLGVANQFGYDGTAFAAHLLAGVPGRVELRARAVALGVIMLPLLVIVVTVVAVLRGEIAALPAAIGILIAGFGVSVAVSSLMSVIAAYALPDTTNPFAMNAGAGTTRGLLVFVGLLAAAALTSPAIVAGFLLTGGWSWLVTVGGLGYGVAAALVGTYIAGDRLDRQGPELLLAVTPRR